jgi:glycosyltransferase involved in cell wall biosynthesis
MPIHLSVVIPCYNEEQNIRLGALDKVAHYMEKQKYSWEVVIVDDGSTDESRELIKKITTHNGHFKLIENPHQGKAGAVITGMLQARGTYALFTDFDQATPIDQVEKLLPWFDKDFDLVIGSRKGRRAGAPLLRRLMGPGFMFIRNVILGLSNIEDTQCGFKMFKNEVAKNIFKRLKVYHESKETSGSRVTAGFDVEVLFVGSRLGYKIKEVPVEWHYVDTRRVSPFMDSLDALVDVVVIRLNSIKGIYNS